MLIVAGCAPAVSPTATAPAHSATPISTTRPRTALDDFLQGIQPDDMKRVEIKLSSGSYCVVVRRQIIQRSNYTQEITSLGILDSSGRLVHSDSVDGPLGKVSFKVASPVTSMPHVIAYYKHDGSGQTDRTSLVLIGVARQGFKRAEIPIRSMGTMPSELVIQADVWLEDIGKAGGPVIYVKTSTEAGKSTSETIRWTGDDWVRTALPEDTPLPARDAVEWLVVNTPAQE